MTPHQQEVTVLVAGLCLSVAALGVMITLSALAFPALSKTGRRLFATGSVIAVTSALAYLVFVTAASMILPKVTP